MRIIKYYGPPGTGKTYTLISTLKHVLSSGIAPQQVAFLSHTKAASEEMKERVVDKLGLAPSDLPWFKTIHACCLRLIGGNTSVLGKREYREFSDQSGYELQGALGLDMVDPNGKMDTWDWPLHWLSVARHRMEPVQDTIDRFGATDMNIGQAEREAFFKAYNSFKDKNGRIDFIDMLDRYLENPSPLPVKIMMVDEAQDLSTLQWKIIESLSKNVEKLYLAGDDDQAIYTFLGADEYGFLDHDCDEEHTLSYSYRCPPKIGDIATRIINKLSHRKKKVVEWNGTRGCGHAALRTTYWNDIDWKRLLERDRNVMVLCPHKAQVVAAVREIESAGFPASVAGRSIADTRLAKAISVFLRIKNGEGIRPAQAAPLCRELGIQTSRLLEMGRKDPHYMVTKDTLDLSWTSNIQTIFDPKYKKYNEVLKIQEIVENYGVEGIENKPKIDVSTMHASKGREADIVVLEGDVYEKMHKAQVAGSPEISRLCYVAVTRAKEGLLVLDRRSNMYLDPLMEVLNV